MKRSQACIIFKEQLRAVWKSRGIIVAFYMYLGFLKEFCRNDRYVQFTKWQIEDMVMCLHNSKINNSIEALEVALSYTRRGGKTRTLTILAVFFAILGLFVVWRSPHTDQLVQAAEWFDMNPFVESQKIRTQFRVTLFDSPDISVAVLSEGRVASREADVLIFDEGGTVGTDTALFDNYKNSRPMIAASKNKYIIHASTDALGTIFNEELNSLREREFKDNTRYTSIHPWTDTTWITEEWIESERKAHLDCSWFVDQNYNCIAVVRGGKIFNNIVVVGSEYEPNFPYGIMDGMIATNGGVDFNGENVGHYLVLIQYNEDYVYVLEEINFWDLELLFDYENAVMLELEEGLFNTQFTEQTSRMGLSCLYQEWSEETKHIRVQELVNRKIVINPYKTPVTYRNVLEAGWDEKSPRPKLKKKPDQHGLDALLHAMNDVEGKIFVQKRHKKVPKILKKTFERNSLIRNLQRLRLL